MYAELKSSRASKISNKKNNGFSLPPSKQFSCPGETTACAKCYAKKGNFVFANTKRLQQDNWEVVNTEENIPAKLSNIMPKNSNIYRIHISGDFFSQEYVDMWADVIKAKPHTRFWAYTRSFHLNFTKLTRLPNFTLWASADEYNLKEAKQFVRRFRKSGTKLAYGPWDKEKEIPDNSFICPATSGKIEASGACEKCMLCVVKKRTNKNVVFIKH